MYNLYHNNSSPIAEYRPDAPLLNSPQDILDFMALSLQDNVQAHIISASSLCPDFFTLSSGLAGEILQKYSNYGLRLAIVGDWSQLKSRSLRDFITECNRGRQVFFVESREEALQRLDK